MRLIALFPITAALALAGCSEGSSLSTSSILGGSGGEVKSAAPAAPVSTPTSRALQVGATSARAAKCGYNFDRVKLRDTFLAYEAQQAPGADQTNTVRTYDTAFSGISKATADKADYCSPAKTTEIKSALNRHLAGDYTPDPPKEKEVEEGLFSGWGSGSSASYASPSISTDNSKD